MNHNTRSEGSPTIGCQFIEGALAVQVTGPQHLPTTRSRCPSELVWPSPFSPPADPRDDERQATPPIAAFEIAPTDESGSFGEDVTILSNDNFVATDRLWDDADRCLEDVGAANLFDCTTSRPLTSFPAHQRATGLEAAT